MPLSDWLPNLLLVAGGLYVGLAGFALSRSTGAVARRFAAVMLFFAGWAITYHGELEAAALDTKLTWFQVRYALSSFTTPLWFALVHEVVGRRPALGRRAWAAVLAMPMVTSMLAATTRHHAWFFSDFRLEQSAGFLLLASHRGPLGWAQLAVAWGFSGASLWLLVGAWLNGGAIVRRQMSTFILAYLLPLVLQVLFVAGVGPLRGINLAAFSFAITAVLWGWTLLRHGTMNLVPVARQVLLDNLAARVVVLDAAGRLAEANHAAVEGFGLSLPHAIGGRIVELVPAEWRPWFEQLDAGGPAEAPRQVVARPGAPWFERSVTSLRDGRGEPVGVLVQLRDVSERVKQHEAAVEVARLKHERRFARQLEFLVRDLHDGIGGITANIAMMAALGARATGEERLGALERIGALASEGNAEVRQLMNALESRELRWSDLLVDFRRAGVSRLEDSGIEFSLRVTGEPPDEGPSLFPGVSLFRIYREALNNVLKHARARRVDVELRFSPSRVELEVRDDGRGLPDHVRPGRGLANMRSRCHELGGELVTESKGGLRVVCSLPLPLRSPADEPEEARA